MPHFDTESRALNLQVVYDGPQRAGKTSSVVALGRLLDCPVVTPGGRNNGTLYFDWLSYTGGRCHGRPIHCRVLTVPGQSELAARRGLMLGTADAVLFVADTSAARFESTRRAFEELREILEQRRRRVPILLQLNKRDADDALDAEEILERLDPELESVETVAVEGWGVREAFVLAVGAALRRLRDSEEFYRSKSYDTQEMQLPNPEQLRQLLEGL